MECNAMQTSNEKNELVDKTFWDIGENRNWKC